MPTKIRSDHLVLWDEVCLGELPPKGLLEVEVAAPDGGAGAGPDREDGVPESSLVVREDAVRVGGSVGVKFFQQVGVESLCIPREKPISAGNPPAVRAQ